MAFAFAESSAGLVYSERLSPWPRLVIASFGVSMFAIPYPFVLYGSWGTLSLTTLVAAAGVVLPVLVGLATLAIALAGVHRMDFDSRRRVLLHITQGPLATTREEIGFERLEKFEVLTRVPENGEPTHCVVLTITDRRPLELGVFATLDEAEHWRRRLQARLAA